MRLIIGKINGDFCVHGSAKFWLYRRTVVRDDWTACIGIMGETVAVFKQTPTYICNYYHNLAY